MIFLGLAADLSGKDIWRQLWTWGREKDWLKLRRFLAKHYEVPVERVEGYANGRTAISAALLALREWIPEGSEIVINGFTCRAVTQAVKAVGCVPVFADVKIPEGQNESVHFGAEELEEVASSHKKIRAVIVQNTLGVGAKMNEIEKIAKNKQWLVIEDLAHGIGLKYEDGREFGTRGDAVIMSFGKGKAVNVISGGMCIVRKEGARELERPEKAPKIGEMMRSRIYGAIGLNVRCLKRIKLTKLANCVMAWCLMMGWVKKSAEGEVDLKRRLSFWQARILNKRIAEKRFFNRKPQREMALVGEREKVLKQLEKEGLDASDFWYEVPVAPKRYFHKVGYPKEGCERAKWVAEHIINLPNWYEGQKMRRFWRIVEESIIKYKEEVEK